MFGLIKKVFIVLLTSIVSTSNHTNCLSLSNEKCMIQPTFFILHTNEYSQEFRSYPFAVKLDKLVWSCNTLNEVSNKVCLSNKSEYLNLSVFNMITWINELKTLTKHLSCKYKCKPNGRKTNSNQK